jgi:phosphopantothenoylcysteine decarboxylase/phosphopantothenate--cysteine ligase
MWEKEFGNIPHIELATWADAFVIVPATANIIGKFANGIADDLLSTNHLALPETVVKIIYPTMNTRMLTHPAVQQNMKTLFSRGWDVQAPLFGMLQCGVEGDGKLAKERDIVSHVNEYLETNNPELGRPMFGVNGRR